MLIFSTISGNMASRVDHVTDMFCLAEDDERLLFRLKPMCAADAPNLSSIPITMAATKPDPTDFIGESGV